VWLSTPRQIAALIRASDRAHNRRLADDIYAARLAHHGKDSAVKDALKRLQKGA